MGSIWHGNSMGSLFALILEGDISSFSSMGILFSLYCLQVTRDMHLWCLAALNLWILYKDYFRYFLAFSISRFHVILAKPGICQLELNF